MKQALVSQKQYAEHLGVSRQAVNRMLHTGKIPNTHGKIHIPTADAALADAYEPIGGITLAEAIRRKEAALAGLRELELRIKQGEVISVSDCLSAMSQSNQIIRSRLLAMPTKLGGQLPLKDDDRRKVVAMIEREIYQMLNELAATLTRLDFHFVSLLCDVCRARIAGETLEGNHEQPQ
jgi:hypothetical protein